MKKLLWVDDDEKLIDSAVPVFERHGFRVLKAVNTSRALTILREEDLDGVLLDVRLAGGENGLELLEELTANHSDVKVAIFTAYPGFDDHVRAEELGAAVYFEKVEKSIPLDPDRQRAFFSALHRVFPAVRRSSVAPRDETARATPGRTLWIIGSFFLLSFVIVLAGVAVVARVVSPLALPVIVIACAVFYLLVAAFAAQQGGRAMTQRNFLSLIAEPLRLIHLLKDKPARGGTRRGAAVKQPSKE